MKRPRTTHIQLAGIMNTRSTILPEAAKAHAQEHGNKQGYGI